MNAASSAAAMRLVIVDDHEGYRSGILRAASAHPAIEVVGVGADGNEGLELIVRHEPDVALVDIRMPNADGFTLMRALRELDPPPPSRIVLLTAEPDPALAEAATGLGAAGFLSKDLSRLEILREILAVRDRDPAPCRD